MKRQEWRGVMFRKEVSDVKRFVYALLMDDVERWTIIPTLRPQSVAEHAFNVAMIADAFCEELGLGRGSLIRNDTMRWALWHDADEIFTGDIPTPAKMQIPKHIMKEINNLSGANTHLEECGDTLSVQLVKLADNVESCRFLSMWGVEPSKSSIIESLKQRVRNMIEGNLSLAEVALAASKFMAGGDITWWMESIQPKSKSEDSQVTLVKMPYLKELLSQSKMISQTECGPSSSQTLTQKEKREKPGLKKSRHRSTKH